MGERESTLLLKGIASGVLDTGSDTSDRAYRRYAKNPGDGPSVLEPPHGRVRIGPANFAASVPADANGRDLDINWSR